MGEIETKSRKRARRKNVQKIILQTIAAAGVVSVAVMAPNALQMMKVFGLKPVRRQREYITAAQDRLMKKGLIELKGETLCLTAAGEALLTKIDAKRTSLKKPKRWDGKWRMLIFDIPERRRGTREKLRRTLLAAGFARVQDSVWVYPYECEEFIALLKGDLLVGRDMRYIIADSLEGDERYRTHFSVG